VQSDGKIIVVGLTGTSSSSSTNDFFAARYNADGTLDTSFGGGLGYAVINVSRLDGERYCLPGRYPKRRQESCSAAKPTAISAWCAERRRLRSTRYSAAPGR